MDLMISAFKTIGSTVLDVLPIALFLLAFQALVIRRALPNVKRMLAGFALVIVGLGLFLIGLEQALFPVGRHPSLRRACAKKRRMVWTRIALPCRG